MQNTRSRGVPEANFDSITSQLFSAVFCTACRRYRAAVEFRSNRIWGQYQPCIECSSVGRYCKLGLLPLIRSYMQPVPTVPAAAAAYPLLHGHLRRGSAFILRRLNPVPASLRTPAPHPAPLQRPLIPLSTRSCQFPPPRLITAMIY